MPSLVRTSSSIVPARVPPEVTRDMLYWYDRHRRVLPWRAAPGTVADPYAVWLSEIMLQQTMVQAVKPYFAAFLAAWPTVADLAAATLDDVLRAWAGLGYYSRARNLHACARVVSGQHGGLFPSTEPALRALPGIGAYTAAAIAAIAFGRQATVVDGNVERVMARLYAVDVPLRQAKPMIRAKMGGLTPKVRPGDFAQAVMDLGAGICTPKRPACVICPLAPHCMARALGVQGDLPRREPKVVRPVRCGTAYFIENQSGQVLLRTRPPSGLLASMSELPGTPWVVTEPSAPGSAGLTQRQRHAGTVKHVFSHFTLLLEVIVAEPSCWRDAASEFGPETRWVDGSQIERQALPTLMRKAILLAKSKDQSSTSTPA